MVGISITYKSKERKRKERVDTDKGISFKNKERVLEENKPSLSFEEIKRIVNDLTEDENDDKKYKKAIRLLLLQNKINPFVEVSYDVAKSVGLERDYFFSVGADGQIVPNQHAKKIINDKKLNLSEKARILGVSKAITDKLIKKDFFNDDVVVSDIIKRDNQEEIAKYKEIMKELNKNLPKIGDKIRIKSKITERPMIGKIVQDYNNYYLVRYEQGFNEGFLKSELKEREWERV